MVDSAEGPHEPWHPQSGDHVRVRLSGECRSMVHCIYEKGDPRGEGFEQEGHDPAEDGAFGKYSKSYRPSWTRWSAWPESSMRRPDDLPEHALEYG